jgi:DNA-binding SARP family transcriptional activator
VSRPIKDTSVQIHLLGTPRIAVDGREIGPQVAKAFALLAYLAIADGPVPRERLMGLLWAESFAEAARKNLRNTLWTLRKAMGEEVVRAQGDRLTFGDHVEIDIRVFERFLRSAFAPSPAAPVPNRAEFFQAALASYGGPLLDGIVLQEAPEFETWLVTNRERLQQKYLRLLYEAVEQARGDQHWNEVITLAQTGLRQDPFQEPLHQRLIEALARSGQRAEALRQYETLRGLLERELGVAPLPETEALRAQIRDEGAGTLTRSADQASSTLTRVRAPVLGERPGGPFIGRDKELLVLDSALERSLDGQAQVVLLTGDLGMGKTRLWREWSAHLAPDLAILEMRSLSATQALPFTPLLNLFASPVCTRQLFRPGSPVAPIWLAEAARLLPDIRRTMPDLPPVTALPPDEERRRLFEAFVQCLQALEASGLVLFSDDMQWIDQATLDWLAYLVARMQDRPLLLVGTYRAEDVPPALHRQIMAWQREGILERAHLERLADDELAALLAALPGTEAQKAQVRERSAGNPYVALELLQAAPGAVPLALADLIRTRLERLPEGARQVLQAAAVLEPDIGYAVLRRTSGRSDDETLDALDALLHGALLVEQAGDYAFAHPLIAPVVMTTMSQARKAFLHRRAAEGREALAGGQLLPIAGRLAEHYHQAGDSLREASFAELAADYALSLAAPGAAVAWLERALALAPKPLLWRKLGQARERMGDLAAARAALERAAPLFVEAGDAPSARHTWLDLAYSFLSSGQGEQASTLAARVLADTSADTDPYGAAYGEFLIGAGMQQQGLACGATEAHLRAAATIAAAHGLPQLTARSQFQLGNLLAEAGELPGAISAFRAAIPLAHQAGDLFQEVLGYNNLAYHLVLAGELADARATIEAGLALNEAQGLQVPRQWLYSTRGELALAEKQWAEATVWFERGLAEARQQHNHAQIASYYANLGRAAAGRGERDQAVTQLREGQQLAQTVTNTLLQTQINLWLAELYLHDGDRPAAQAQFAMMRTRPGDPPGLVRDLVERLQRALE